MEYRCLLSGNSVTGSRECGSLEPSGTVVTPICRSPNYYSSGVMSNMHCVEGSWDYIAVCKPGLTNVTISIDSLEIIITSDNAHVIINNYGNKEVKVVNNISNADRIVFEDSRTTTSRPTASRTTTSGPTSANYDNEIDEGDWRMASVDTIGFQAQPVRPKSKPRSNTKNYNTILYYK